jgi:trigger factor
MQVQQTVSGGLRREYKITVPADDINKKINDSLAQTAKKMKLPGFRPGKVPLAMIKQRYGQQVTQEAVEAAINETYQTLLNDKKLRQAGQPVYNVHSFEEGKDLVYDLALEVLPEIELLDFKKIKLEKLIVEVSEKEVDAALENIVAEHKKYKDLEKPRAARKGDLVSFQLTAKNQGEIIGGFNSMSLTVVADGEKFVFPEIEKALVGMKIEGSKEIDQDFPADFGDKLFAGKKVTWAINVTGMQEQIVFTIGDELAKEFECKDLADFRLKVREAIESDNNKMARIYQKRHLLDSLASQYNFDLPKAMTEGEFTTIWQRLQDEIADAKAKGNFEDDGDKSDDELRAEYQAIAERRVRLGLLISEVSKTHNINLTEEELRSLVLQEALRYREQAKQVVDYYQKNPSALKQLSATAMEDKVVDFILSKIEHKEVKVSIDALKAKLKGILPGIDGDEDEAVAKPKKTASKKVEPEKATSEESTPKKVAPKKTAAKGKTA